MPDKLYVVVFPLAGAVPAALTSTSMVVLVAKLRVKTSRVPLVSGTAVRSLA